MMRVMVLKKGRPSKRLVELASRKRDPIRPESMSLAELLYSMLGNQKAAEAIADALNGDIRNIHNWDVRDLEALPGVGQGTVGKLVALVEIIRRLVQKR